MISLIVLAVAIAIVLFGLCAFFIVARVRQRNAASDAFRLKPRLEYGTPNPPSNYGELPFNSASDYAANASEFKSGIPQESNYGVIHDADHYAKNAAEFTAGVAQEPTYSKIGE